uniref:Uncharacterized protein n=1 Tax=Sphaerodactylus townsendi TaxID=933632 RepID=A0ACB8FIY8_9SAUR
MYLSFKAAFLVAVTSAHRVVKLRARRSDPPYQEGLCSCGRRSPDSMRPIILNCQLHDSLCGEFPLAVLQAQRLVIQEQTFNTCWTIMTLKLQIWLQKFWRRF